MGLRHRALRPSVGKDSDARAGAASVRLRGGRRQGGRGQGNQRSRQGMSVKVGAVFNAQNGVKLFYVGVFGFVTRYVQTISCLDMQNRKSPVKGKDVVSRYVSRVEILCGPGRVSQRSPSGTLIYVAQSRVGSPESGANSRCRNPMVRRMRILSTVILLPPVSDIFGQL